MMTSRRAFHFALRRGSSLAAVRGIGSDGTSAARAHQRPCHCGGRFSAKASSPSLASSDASSSSNSVPRDLSAACRRARSRPRGRRAGWPAPRAEPPTTICRATRSASSSAAPGSTSRLTSPRSNARRGVDRLTGEDGVHRRRPTDRAREPEQPAGRGDQVAPNLRESERRSGRRHDDVGREDDLQTARGRQTVDGDHDRLRALAVHEPAEPAPLGVERRRGTRLPDRP